MTAIVFDTLKFVKKLTHAGIIENHAHALSEALQDTHIEAKWVTQHILKSELNILKQEFKELELRIDNKIEKIQGELNLLKWMVGFQLAGMVTIMVKIFL